ncbi:MAG: protein translocase subunit SecF, partial [Selenomonadaceae bacterium]|nr:protein translocase subunit SecF [Selenomonadaceae bacterium]
MPSFDIAGRGKVWFIISLLIIIPGIFSMLTHGFNFGIDFTGGTIIDLKFEQPVSLSQVRNSLKPYGLDGSTI